VAGALQALLGISRWNDSIKRGRRIKSFPVENKQALPRLGGSFLHGVQEEVTFGRIVGPARTSRADDPQLFLWTS